MYHSVEYPSCFAYDGSTFLILLGLFMKKISFWFPIFLVMLVMAGCSSSVEDSRSAPTMDDSTKQTIEKLQKEEDQAMNFNSVPAANENSTEPVR